MHLHFHVMGTFYWPSSTLGTSTNHMFMSHKQLHLPFHVMGKWMGNFSLVTKLAIFPFSHLNQSMSFHITKNCICLFISWGKSRTILFGLSLWALYLPFHISKLNTQANDIWVHTWINKSHSMNFEKIFWKVVCFRTLIWSHLGLNTRVH